MKYNLFYTCWCAKGDDVLQYQQDMGWFMHVC